MIGFILRHPIAVSLSVVLHVAIVLLVTMQWHSASQAIKVSLPNQEEQSDTSDSIEPKLALDQLETFAVDSSLVNKQLARLKAEEEARLQQQKLLEAKTDKERQRLIAMQQKREIEQAKAEKARKAADEQRKRADEQRKQADEERKKVAAEKLKAEEAKRLAATEREKAEKAKQATLAAEKLRLEEEKRKQVLDEEIALKAEEKRKLEIAAKEAQAEKEREQAAAELQRKLAAEATARRAEQKRKQMLSLRETYISSIAAKVKDNWRTPARIAPDAQCDIQITQTPQGNVSSVKVLNCNASATKQFREAAEKAVYRSEPIPKPPVEELFERVITFEFKP